MAKRDAIFLLAGGVLGDQPLFGGEPQGPLAKRSVDCSYKPCYLRSERFKASTVLRRLELNQLRDYRVAPFGSREPARHN